MYLTLGDLELILTKMLEQRRLLEQMLAGQLYLRHLEQQLALIRSLPAALRSQPLAGSLASEAEIHDDVASAFWYLCEAYRIHPGVPEEVRKSAEALRQTFLPSRSELRDSYSDKAVRAKHRETELERHRDVLSRFVVAGGGETLADWVKTFIDRGKKLDGLLEQRGQLQAVSKSERGQASFVRSTTVGILGRLRDSLRDEVAANPALDRATEARLFGHHDELMRLRENQARAQAKKVKDGEESPTEPDGPMPPMPPSSEAKPQPRA